MEHLVVSLGTARKLRAAGFPQETAHAWGIYQGGEPALRPMYGPTAYRLHWFDEYAAPTAQEIMNELVSNRNSGTLTFRPFNEEYKTWLLEADGESYTSYVEDGDNIAELLAGAWLQLYTRRIK